MPVVLAQVRGLELPQVAAALRREWPGYEEWPINPANPFLYGQMIRANWTGEDDLLICERDILPPPDSVARLWECPFPWCAHEVWLGNHYSHRTLGLVKFSNRLQRWAPVLADRALGGPGTGRTAAYWPHVDSNLIRELDALEIRPHLHQPRARHLHYESEPVS